MKIAVGSILIIIMFSFSCSPKNSKEAEGADNLSDKDTQLFLPEGFAMEGDSIILPSFEFEVSLSQKAEKKIATTKETIIVRAYLSGNPKDSTTSPMIDEMGEVNLGSPEIQLRKPGVARFKGVKISKKGYELLGDKDFQVLINVFSGRKSSDMNLIECEIFQEPLTVARKGGHVLKGKLIGEE